MYMVNDQQGRVTSNILNIIININASMDYKRCLDTLNLLKICHT